MLRILVTGANRGVGFEIVRQYLKRTDTHIFAACRTPDRATALHQLAAAHPQQVTIITMDAGDQASIEASAAAVRVHTSSLDILINNAGIFPDEPQSRHFGHLTAQAMLEVLHINSVAPVLVAQAYFDLLKASSHARIINVSSEAGSLHQQSNGCAYSYNASKAALNMFTRCLAAEMRAHQIITITLHPGWVQTDMGGPNARITPEESGSGIVALAERLTMTDTNKFYDWDGKEHAW